MAIRQIGNNTFVGLFSELPATGTSGTVFVAENTNGVYYYFSGGTASQISSSITSGRVGYGSVTNTLTDSSRFLWDNTNSQLELNGNLFGIKLKENLNNRYITISNGSLGGATLVMKNQLNQTLFNLNNPVNANDSAQLAIGDVNSIPAESQLYIYGGNNGANIDMRGKPSRDECNIDFEGADWATNPNSLGMSYFGALFSASTATTLNYPKQKMGIIRWGEANKAVIVSNNSTGMTPIMLGINDIEIGQVNDKGFEYKSNFASANTSNNRWLTDKEYVDNSILKSKSGSVAFTSFTGSPYSYDIVFITPFADALYSPSIIGVDARSWTVSNVTASGFRIETNSSTILTGSVYWVATKHGEN